MDAEINENEVKIDTIISNQTTISGLIDDLEGFTDTLESGQASLSGQLVIICDKIIATSGALVIEINENESLLNDILDNQTQISGINDSIESGIIVISGLVDQLEQGQVTLSGLVDTLESGQTIIIDCTDQLKDGQVIISGLVDDLEGLTDTLESGQASLSGQLVDVCDKIIGVSGILDTGHTDLSDKILATSGLLQIEINENEVKLDTALSGITDLCNKIIAMSGAIPGDVWTFATRTLTSVSGLEVNVDASGVLEIASGVWAHLPNRTLTGDFELGDGSIIVDHNFGGSDNLRVLNSSTSQPIDNVLITAFLKSDFDAGNTGNVYIKAQSRTTVDGRWESPMNLDPETYTLLFSKQSIFFNEITEIIVT